MNVPIEHTHGGHGAKFTLDGLSYWVSTCCAQAEVHITDEDARQCETVCPRHATTIRTYAPALTDERRAQLDWQVVGLDDSNPISDPFGDKQQRRRKSGYTTSKWHEARS